MNQIHTRITSTRFDAALFDLDGVLTATAKIHAACWKRLFDEFLKQHAEKTGQPFVRFDLANDYKLYVDGKMRYVGVKSFLESRGIQLPEGDANESPNYDTIRGLGNFKDIYFGEVLRSEGIEVYDGSITLVRCLRQQGLKTAVVSSSHHCQEVLKVADIEDCFSAIVDGNLADQLHLAGKPAPDAFLLGAKRLGVEPSRTVVFEDALSGVQAGRAGQFGLVVGVDRAQQADALLQNGADIVVQDLRELAQ